MAQPPTTQAPETSLQQQLIDAYSKMRTGALLLIVSWLLNIVAIFAGLDAILGAILAVGFGGPRGPEERIAAAIAAMAPIIVVALIALVIQLIGLFAKFIPGTKDLARADVSFSTTSKLISVGYTWGFIILALWNLILIAAVAFENLGVALGTLWMAFIGVILILIGEIGAIILAIMLYGKEEETLYLVTGILLILSFILLFLPLLGAILDIIAWILFYLALGRSIVKLELSLELSLPDVGA